jgi:hypothetical protein
VSAKVIPIRPGMRPVSAEEAAAHWRQRAANARSWIPALQAQLDAAHREVARCEARARLAEENPTCPPPRATEETGSPTRSEGDPL